MGSLGWDEICFLSAFKPGEMKLCIIPQFCILSFHHLCSLLFFCSQLSQNPSKLVTKCFINLDCTSVRNSVGVSDVKRLTYWLIGTLLRALTLAHFPIPLFGTGTLAHFSIPLFGTLAHIYLPLFGTLAHFYPFALWYLTTLLRFRTLVRNSVGVSDVKCLTYWLIGTLLPCRTLVP